MLELSQFFRRLYPTQHGFQSGSEGSHWDLSKNVVVRKANMADTNSVDTLLSEWLDFKPRAGRLESIRRAISNRELIIAEVNQTVIGFIHYVLHEDIIDGDPNSFITAFYVTKLHRGKQVGTHLLEHAIADSITRGAVGVETSTIHGEAKKFYEKLHFKQTMGDIGEVFLELDLTEYLRAKKLA